MVHREAGKGRIIPENFQTFPATAREPLACDVREPLASRSPATFASRSRAAREPLATAREPLACDRLIRYNLDKVYNRHEQTSPVKYELK